MEIPTGLSDWFKRFEELRLIYPHLSVADIREIIKNENILAIRRFNNIFPRRNRYQQGVVYRNLDFGGDDEIYMDRRYREQEDYNRGQSDT